MNDTPRTDRDDRPYPSPEHAQHIRFEGNDCLVMHPEEYEALYEQSRQLERELAAEKDASEQLEMMANKLHEQLAAVIAERDELKNRLCNRPAVIELAASQQEVARLREELAAIRNYGKGNSVWAASKESKMADAALSSTPAPPIAALASTPAPVHSDTERLNVLEICAKALRDCEDMVKNEIMKCEFAKTSANAWPDLLTGCVSGGGIQSAIAAIDAELAQEKGQQP